MKYIFRNALILCLAFLLVTGGSVFAGSSNRAGTNAASELLIPVGARYIAMGGAATGIVSGLESMYWNPAGLDRMQGNAGGMFSYMNYIADISVSYLAVAARFGGVGSVGLTFKTLGFGDIAITTEDNPDGTGELFTPQFIIVGLTYSRALTDRVSVGANMKIVSETMDRVSATGTAFDIGAQYRSLGGIDGLNLGVVLKNLGGGMQYDGTGLIRKMDPEDVSRSSSQYKVIAGNDELPSTMEIGLGYTYKINDENSLAVNSDFVNNNYQEDALRLGGEYNFQDLFFLRGGYGIALDAQDDALGESSSIFGFTLGAGFHYDMGGFTFTLDYAYRDVTYFDANNVFTVKLGF